MSSSVYVDNKNKDIFILGKRPTHGLDSTALSAEQKILLVLKITKKILFKYSLKWRKQFFIRYFTKIFQSQAKICKIK